MKSFFGLNTVTAYPTNTSFGLGVMINDEKGLEKLAEMKGGREGKFFSLMVSDMAMLKDYAEVPEDVTEAWFEAKPRTAILKPTKKLPKSKYWPENKVAFRISQIQVVKDATKAINTPITATSANLGGESPLYAVTEIKKTWNEKVFCPFVNHKTLEKVEPSEIWDFCEYPAKRIR